MTINTPADKRPRILTRSDGSSIAYHQTPGRGIGVVFLHGLHSNMDGGKALHVEACCQAQGRPFLRFDQFGHGQSSGDFIDGTISRWTTDTIAVIEALCDGPQVLIGSSMGGWVMLRTAVKRPDLVAGLVGIAPAPDFTNELLSPDTPQDQRDALERDGVIYFDSEFSDEPYALSKALFDDGAANCILQAPISFHGPVRILHGQQDTSVSWRQSLTLVDQLESDDVLCTFVKAGDHSLSSPDDLDRLSRTLDEIFARLNA